MMALIAQDNPFGEIQPPEASGEGFWDFGQRRSRFDRIYFQRRGFDYHDRRNLGVV